MTPPLTKGDARPLWKPQYFVPASRGGVKWNLTERIRIAHCLAKKVRKPSNLAATRSCAALVSLVISGRRLPVQRESLPTCRTFPQVQVNERPSWNPSLSRNRFKIFHRSLIKPHGDFSLKPLSVRVGLRLGKIVMLSHRFHLLLYCVRSDRSAVRAEIRRITSSASR